MTTRGGGFVGRVGMDAHSRILRMKTHVLPFTDHTGKEALMIFQGREKCPLPPLYSFAIYFTHKDVNTENVQPTELLDAIRRGTPLQNYPCPFRLETFFLPAPSEDAASDEACIAHYREEKRSRGDYMRQIEAVDTPGNNTGTGGLPGFVPSYIDDPYGDFHHGRLYNYQGSNWRTDKRPVRRVFFDPIPQEQYAPIAEEAGEPAVLPPVSITLHAMQKSDTEDLGASFVGLTMHDTANGKTQNETDGPWQEAVERGWATW